LEGCRAAAALKHVALKPDKDFVGRVRIHCYGCDQTVSIEESSMSQGLGRAGWALDAGETFCSACAARRGLEAEAPARDLAHATATDVGDELEPFAPQASVIGERRGMRALRLLRASASVLRGEPELLVFPAVGMALTLLLGALCFALSLSSAGATRNARGVILVASLIAGYPITFVSLYCGVALAAVLGGRLNGEQLTASDGWAAARERAGIIAAWTLVTCTVGAALRVIEQYVPLGAKIVVAILDWSWSLATMFAVPVLAYENLGPRETFQRSAHIFRQRWGTQLGGVVGISVASVFFYIPFIVLLLIGVATPGASGVLLATLGGAGMFAAIAVQTALDQIFRVFVYRSAVGLDTTAGPFEQSDLQAPFTRRRRRL
jgi:hypothetical protein